MVRARNIYAGNDINRVFRVVYYYGTFVLHFLPLKCTPAKKKNNNEFPGALQMSFTFLLEHL